jgi:hypothetical protein
MTKKVKKKRRGKVTTGAGRMHLRRGKASRIEREKRQKRDTDLERMVALLCDEVDRDLVSIVEDDVQRARGNGGCASVDAWITTLLGM